MIRPATATAIALWSVAAPAMAWEFGMVGDQTFWTGTRDREGRTQLVFFCTQAMPGIVQLQILTPEPGPAGPVAVELSIATSEGHFGPVSARATSLDGKLTIATTGVDLAAMNAAQSVYLEADEISLSYYESTWHYPGADRSEGFGAMLDACG
ncbi:hypothetical protein JI749_11870 [Devosia oryziradicis]|uniref:Uncharacterized protein n=1 Tax=Devosia oryziradicis TaxID=2801335 RepID=A0ABX7BT29_9HYPH|nr:hypothetical protein [Devosia oryziradicis]QQR35073.1 hypothetical protein JI749_11870 [Devosia oryziradicis]